MFEYQNFNSKIDNEHKVILTIIVRRQKSNKTFKFTVLQCISLPLGMGAIFLPKWLYFYIFPLIISFYIFVFPFVYVILAVILFCFLFPIRSVRSPLAIGSCFCLFLFSYFEIRFNILASIYVIIIFIDSFCVCMNISWDRCGRKSNFDKRKKFLWARA